MLNDHVGQFFQINAGRVTIGYGDELTQVFQRAERMFDDWTGLVRVGVRVNVPLGMRI